jgi:hypothetical protein
MLDKTDLQLQASAMNMWANYVETGDVNLSAQDAQNCKKPFRALDHHQMRMVLHFRDLSSRLLRQDSSAGLSSKQVAHALPAPQENGFKFTWVEDPLGEAQTLKVGAIAFGKVSHTVTVPTTSTKRFQATFMLKGIQADQGLYATAEEAKARLERAARGWLKALEA